MAEHNTVARWRLVWYWTMMLHCIGLNGSFFNTHRMMQQYVFNAYYK